MRGLCPWPPSLLPVFAVGSERLTASPVGVPSGVPPPAPPSATEQRGGTLRCGRLVVPEKGGPWADAGPRLPPRPAAVRGFVLPSGGGGWYSAVPCSLAPS